MPIRPESPPGKQRVRRRRCPHTCAKGPLEPRTGPGPTPPSSCRKAGSALPQGDPRLGTTGRAASLTSYKVRGESLNLSDTQVFLLKMGANMGASGLMCVEFSQAGLPRELFRAGSSCLN